MAQAVPALDLIAFLWFAACYLGYGLLTRFGPFSEKSILTEVQKQRVQWMRGMMARENRLLDAQIISQLSGGHAFFASTTIIVIGGLGAAFAAADDVKRLLETLPFIAKASLPFWEAKLLVLITLFVIAFFQFAWAFRLAHYTGIMIGAAPYPPGGDEAENARLARRIARLAGISAEHANDGLRAYYFAIAGISWFLHPALLILAATAVVIILYRREYRSRAFKTISRLAEISRDR